MTAREAELTEQLAQSQEALAAAVRENQLLRQKVDLLIRRVFGSSSEKLEVGQLQLLQLAEVASTPEPVPAPPSEPIRTARVRQPKALGFPTTCPWWRKCSIPSR